MDQINELRLAEIISALSFALDLTEGAVPGHALRTTLLGMRIAAALGLPDRNLADLFFALQLKDIGCSSNAARICQIFAGDDRAAKSMSKLTDWTGLMNGASSHQTMGARIADLSAGLQAVPRNVRMLWSVVEPGGSAKQKLQRISELGRHTEENTREVISLRCDRGARILGKLKMSAAACEAVRSLDERWDGKGFPDRLAGQEIPLLARIACAAQNLDALASAFGVKESLDSLQRRSGTWFDPEIVTTTQSLQKAGFFWRDCEPGCSVERTRRAALQLAPKLDPILDASQIDEVCEAFSEVVDAKSPFTYRHSVGVTEVAVSLAEDIGLPKTRVQLVRRAALLHDIGKLGVSNAILDKPGKLTEAERKIVNTHPGSTRSILSRITGFDELARIAGEHHEKLDGSGYPNGLTADQLGIESRLLTLADCFVALAEERPYRGPLPRDRVFEILWKEAPQKLDADLLEVLEALVFSAGNAREPQRALVPLLAQAAVPGVFS